jgi:hypothetical protein
MSGWFRANSAAAGADLPQAARTLSATINVSLRLPPSLRSVDRATHRRALSSSDNRRVGAENLIAGDEQGRRDLLKGQCRRSPAPEKTARPSRDGGRCPRGAQAGWWRPGAFSWNRDSRARRGRRRQAGFAPPYEPMRRWPVGTAPVKAMVPLRRSSQTVAQRWVGPESRSLLRVSLRAHGWPEWPQITHDSHQGRGDNMSQAARVAAGSGPFRCLWSPYGHEPYGPHFARSTTGVS